MCEASNMMILGYCHRTSTTRSSFITVTVQESRALFGSLIHSNSPHNGSRKKRSAKNSSGESFGHLRKIRRNETNPVYSMYMYIHQCVSPMDNTIVLMDNIICTIVQPYTHVQQYVTCWFHSPRFADRVKIMFRRHKEETVEMKPTTVERSFSE